MNSFVEMFLRDGEFIRNNEVLNVRLAIHGAPGVDLRTHNFPLRKSWLPFYFTVIWEPNETLLCTSEVGDYCEINDWHPSRDPLQFPVLYHMVTCVGI
jgi:hypothetical protein